VDYFGTDDAPECQMCFHFPVMSMLYYSLREEKATPVIDVMAQTPAIPAGTQWGTFLRNHDELTLEMVTPEQRAAMYGWYAPDPRMRANVGIRRRLAPLLDNSRAEIELIHALLLSLPGSPCLYYGDEIGMGDNIWLNDRDSVRTPMQWTPDRNAGFSSTDPGKLFLPVVSSLVYHYNNVNVEAQMASSASLLHWLRAMLAVRKQHPVFGRGAFEVCAADNESLLAFLRVDRSEDGTAGDEAVLCVNNLASRPQAATIRVPDEFKGGQLADLFGGQGFPKVSDDGTITLTVRGTPDRLELTVADTGEGISESDLPYVFDSFYRGEPARTRASNSAASAKLRPALACAPTRCARSPARTSASTAWPRVWSASAASGTAASASTPVTKFSGSCTSPA